MFWLLSWEGNMGDKAVTTQWSQVLAARDGSDSEARAALEGLCQTYWRHLYLYIRHMGIDHDEAMDLTQGLFTELLESDFLAKVDPSKGRFRTFLLASARHYLAHESRRARALKRGGSRRTLSLDTEVDAEFCAFGDFTGRTPKEVFERSWAITVLDRAMDRLREYSTASLGPTKFERLRLYLTSREPQAPYSQVAVELRMSEGAVRTAVHRLRIRFGQCLRDEIAEIVADPADIDDEIRYLLELVSYR